jgi:hypothetical protein
MRPHDHHLLRRAVPRPRGFPGRRLPAGRALQAQAQDGGDRLPGSAPRHHRVLSGRTELLRRLIPFAGRAGPFRRERSGLRRAGHDAVAGGRAPGRPQDDAKPRRVGSGRKESHDQRTRVAEKVVTFVGASREPRADPTRAFTIVLHGEEAAIAPFLGGAGGASSQQSRTRLIVSFPSESSGATHPPAFSGGPKRMRSVASNSRPRCSLVTCRGASLETPEETLGAPLAYRRGPGGA